MTRRDILSLALKIVGVFWIFHVLELAGSVVGVFLGKAGLSPTPTTTLTIVWAATVAFLALVAVLLIVQSDRIAGWLDRGKATEERRSAVDREGVREVAFCVVGLYAILKSLPMLANWVNIRVHASEGGPMSLTSWGGLIGPAFQFLIGLLLFLGSRAVWRFFSRVWKAGRVEGMPGQEPPEGPEAGATG